MSRLESPSSSRCSYGNTLSERGIIQVKYSLYGLTTELETSQCCTTLRCQATWVFQVVLDPQIDYGGVKREVFILDDR